MNVNYFSTPKFPFGQLVATPNALSKLAAADIIDAIARHGSGDWGDVDLEDARANQEALVNGHRLLSGYTSSTGVRFWIITEADRSATTVLLPEDY